jgi:hypothetical protein
MVEERQSGQGLAAEHSGACGRIPVDAYSALLTLISLITSSAFGVHRVQRGLGFFSSAVYQLRELESGVHR